ncbi:hypothetical protein FRC06_002433 [Ceratobasidium sp. 370]|nr:hypothetical protein FRC06_002433 [Ceratobasidium sp. 370]
MCGTPRTQSIPALQNASCSFHLTDQVVQRWVLGASGMHEYLESIMPTFPMPVRVRSGWIFYGFRWLACMTDVPGGWDTCRLDQVGYFPDSEKYHAFEFVDPIDVIRAVHLIPRFVGNQTAKYLESVDSLAADTRSVGDWKHYYVGRFADRDMLLRFIGMAIGHMTPGNASESAAGVPEDALAIGYEYDEELEPAASEVEQKGANESDEAEDAEEAENDEDEDESNDGSDAKLSNSENEDVLMEGDGDEGEDEDVSW